MGHKEMGGEPEDPAEGKGKKITLWQPTPKKRKEGGVAPGEGAHTAKKESPGSELPIYRHI